jgi:hypothetical protein
MFRLNKLVPVVSAIVYLFLQNTQIFKLLDNFLHKFLNHMYPYFLAVLAACLNCFAVGAPLEPGLRIFSPEP